MIETLFRHGALLVPCPWPRAGRRKSVLDVDAAVVRALLARPPGDDLEEVDPSDLRSTQPSVTRSGVAYYLTDAYHRTGTTYADMHSAANRVPVLYRRDDGQTLILTGHHRSTAALLAGRPLLARVAAGGWGGPRDEPLVKEALPLVEPTRPLHVTPGLAVGPDAVAADAAVAEIVAGHRAAVVDVDTAAQVLGRVGCPGEAVADRLRFARTGRT